MRGLKKGHYGATDSESDEASEEHQQESPAILEGVEQNDQSLNIKINKKKMFANKPPIIPQKQTQDLQSLAQQKLLEINRLAQ